MTQFYTLRETLRELSEQRPAVTVRAGANSPFGRRGRRLNPATLLDTLPSETLDCLVIRDWSTPGPIEYRYMQREAIGWIYLFTPQGKYQPEPVLLVYRADDTPADRGTAQDNAPGEQIGRQERQGQQEGEQMRDATLREALHTLSAYGASIIVRAGASSPYGEEGHRIVPGALLAALEPAELERPAILTWDRPARGYILSAELPIGWLHVFAAPGKIQEAPVLFVYDASGSADRGTDRGEGGQA